MSKRMVSFSAVVSLLAAGFVQPAFSQQNVLVSNGSTPPAGSQVSAVTVTGSSINTGGINNNGQIYSGLQSGTSSSLFYQTANVVQAGAMDTGGAYSSAAGMVVEATGASLVAGGDAPQGATGGSVAVQSGLVDLETTVEKTAPNGRPYALRNAGLTISAETASNIFYGNTFTSGLTNTGTFQNNGNIQSTGNIAAAGTVTAGAGVVANGRVENVEAGVAPTDAVNVQQLQAAANWAQQASQQQFQQLSQQTGVNRRIASTGTAIAMAAASVPALEGTSRFGVGVGTGTYDGRAAVSIAGEMRVSSHVQVRLNVGTGSDGKTAAGAGALMSW
ncbi:hypothetical protein GCM10007898_35190 [Dyella flagellata]|uniref:Trimeric autotransporter adhesin YadA-like C-terminal membrane anchor domain-containing protein n=2 Tax=Dyella flagellata TaxID=1867833 RepID=A0ABQ5XHJ0_9GAMM|nr:hypothetical protein GCM10007898_35190 [Dyella flagellata]